MTDAKLKKALNYVEPNLNDNRVEKIFSGLERKQRRQTILKISAAVLTVIVAAGVLTLVLPSMNSGEQKSETPVLVNQTPKDRIANSSIKRGSFHLPDGTSGVPVGDESHLTVLSATDELVSVRVDRGLCNFKVTPGLDRVFLVRAGQVTIAVLGTEFEVELDGEQVKVRVSTGLVRIEWPGGTDELEAGSSGVYPPKRLDEEVEQKTLVASQKEGTSKDSGPPSRGENSKKPPHGKDRDPVEELLEAADAMRFSGRPLQALPYLEKIVESHVEDSRAPMAEFTRGKVLLLQLGQPRAAALAFRSARQLDPAGGLAQDAMAREVEALRLAGESAEARKLAKEYLVDYPNGRRVHAVRRFGGLD